MFIGREKEIKVLEDAYSQEAFQMVVVYGRRRIGKTTLLDQFVRNKPSLYFTAQQKSATMNLRYFSQEVYRFFGLPLSAGAFETWKDALGFVAENAQRRKEPFVFVFDEFPYAAEADPSLPSVLQAAIDHDFKSTAICMVLCGSNEGFMESEVLGKKSPLYGRRTAQIKPSLSITLTPCAFSRKQPLKRACIITLHSEERLTI